MANPELQVLAEPAIPRTAATTFNEPADCTPEEAVSVLQIHGTDDQTISYDGEEDAYPGAVETTERHAALNGCDPAVATPGVDRLDLVLDLPGNDTDVVTYGSGCDADSLAELWTIQDGPHIPLPPTEQFTPLVLDWLFDRTK